MLAWPAATTLVIAAAFLPVLTGYRTLSFRDVERQYAPLRNLIEEALRSFHLPLWNPYEGTGIPLFAEGVNSVLHPLSLLCALMIPGNIDALIMAYLFAAGLGAYALARTLGISKAASFGSSSAFALSGFTVSMTGNLVFLAGISVLPWLIATLASCHPRHPYGTLRVALATAAAIFSGDVQCTLVGILIGLPMACSTGGIKAFGQAASGLILGILLGGIQLAPSCRHLFLTYRGTGLTLLDMHQWALHPWRLIEWGLPGFFRGDTSLLSAPVFQVFEKGSRFALPFAESVFIGIPVFFFALHGCKSRQGRILFIAALILTWAAMGHHLGAQELLGFIPGWKLFRYAEKLMAPLTLCICLLAGLGLDRFQSGPTSRHSTATALALFALTVLAWVILPTMHTAIRQPVLDSLQRGLPYTVCASGAMALIMMLPATRVKWRIPVLSLLIALQSAAATPFARHFSTPVNSRSPIIHTLDAAAPGPRLLHPLVYDHPDSSSECGSDIQSEINRQIAVPACNVASRIDTLDLYSGFYPFRHENLFRSLGDRRWRFYRRYGVTHVILLPPRNDHEVAILRDATKDGKTILADFLAPCEIVAVPHRPWAFFASEAETVATPGIARDYLMQWLQQDENNFRVVVESPLPLACSLGQVMKVERFPEQIRIDAECKGPGLLIVNDAFWPGWEARIDGRAVPIYPADVLVRAVPWPAGRHILEMHYSPDEVWWGALLSLAGLIGCLSVHVRNVNSARFSKHLPRDHHHQFLFS